MALLQEEKRSHSDSLVRLNSQELNITRDRSLISNVGTMHQPRREFTLRAEIDIKKS